MENDKIDWEEKREKEIENEMDDILAEENDKNRFDEAMAEEWDKEDAEEIMDR